ncbi:hypothetical protein LOTGIDRAFT_231377 [Lottia gigantea]|uniref:TIR domain-containing protein n=1 Tax=Lottia gigantea TaxID=225164 RepID=V4ATQ3_LOTGI|nr:hypothetical protein LOTGIDRAFT_231377 [Lottia gigantea]ESO98295.1 hypothetical protein LOTGIDRAFT_231377 [Lottia gigantea]
MAHCRSNSNFSKLLSDGKKYHYSILYNHFEGPSSKRQGDYLLAWDFLKDLNKRLRVKGYDKVMYHDIAIPGSNIFDNLFNMVNESQKIVVILTTEFLRSGWHKYSGQAAIKKLLDKNESQTRFIPIAINVDIVPDNLGFSHTLVIFHNDAADDDFWDKIYRAMGPKEVHFEQTSVEETSKPIQCGDKLPVEINIPHDSPEISHNSDVEEDGLKSMSIEDEDEDREPREDQENGRMSSESSAEQLPTGRNPSRDLVDDNSHVYSPMSNLGNFTECTVRDKGFQDSGISRETNLDQSKQSQVLKEGSSLTIEPNKEGTNATSESKPEGTNASSKPKAEYTIATNDPRTGGANANSEIIPEDTAFQSHTPLNSPTTNSPPRSLFKRIISLDWIFDGLE